MKTSAIFIVILIILTSYANTQSVLKRIDNLLKNFKKSNRQEQIDANLREFKVRQWCKAKIDALKAELATRTKAVNDVKGHKEFLVKTQIEWENDKTSREKRIQDNDKLLKKFTKERDASRLLYNKNVQGFKDGEATLTDLKKELKAYFNKKINKEVAVPLPLNTAMSKNKDFTQVSSDEVEEEAVKFLQQDTNQVLTQVKSTISPLSDQQHIELIQKSVSKLSNYSKLFDINHSIILDQLTYLTGDISKLEKSVESNNQVGRTKEEIGIEHVDNTVEEIKKLTTPAFDDKDVYNTKTLNKVLGLIDKLIAYLQKNLVEKVIANETKAENDFAKWKTSMDKEDCHNDDKIDEIEKKLKDQDVEIKSVSIQLTKRLQLKEVVATELLGLNKSCRQKYKYFIDETERRDQENKRIDLAIEVYNKIVSKFSVSRALSRAHSNLNKTGYKKEDEVKQRVKDSHKKIKAAFEARLKSRNAEVV